ncbi:hypothetical protein MNV49_004667 [Pseudohyphozyma bogoriensis]|nr:hypothetical protein MNV49_004667 [Pseudohyphozyma bogoriensis]
MSASGVPPAVAKKEAPPESKRGRSDSTSSPTRKQRKVSGSVPAEIADSEGEVEDVKPVGRAAKKRAKTALAQAEDRDWVRGSIMKKRLGAARRALDDFADDKDHPSYARMIANAASFSIFTAGAGLEPYVDRTIKHVGADPAVDPAFDLDPWAASISEALANQAKVVAAGMKKRVERARGEGGGSAKEIADLKAERGAALARVADLEREKARLEREVIDLRVDLASARAVPVPESESEGESGGAGRPPTVVIDDSEGSEE